LLCSLRPPPPCSTLFPYTTLFRSEVRNQLGIVGVAVLEPLGGRGVEHRRQRGRDLRPPGLDVGKRLTHVLHRHRYLVVALERDRSEEHTSELQSPCNLVCRLLLEK